MYLKFIFASEQTAAIVAYLNYMGGMQSLQCDRLTKQIWIWCMQEEIWVSACHVAGKNNTQVDRGSRHFDNNTEWMLRQDIFLSITQLWGKQQIDLFASRLNAQLPCYASWKPDPGASFTDAFTVPWTDYYFYAFPPFSINLCCLQKIEQEEAYTTVVHQTYADDHGLPTTIASAKEHPSKKGSYHQLWQRLHLMACKLSGQPSKSRAFQKR